MLTYGVNLFVEGIWLLRKIVKSDFIGKDLFCIILAQHILSYHLYISYMVSGGNCNVICIWVFFKLESSTADQDPVPDLDMDPEQALPLDIIPDPTLDLQSVALGLNRDPDSAFDLEKDPYSAAVP